MYKLYIKQKVFKITDHYEVLDEKGNAAYYVDQDFKLIGNTVRVRKVDNSQSFVIDKEIFTFMPRFTISFNDGKIIRIKQNFTFFRKDIDLISDDYDLKLVGNFWDLDFEVYDGGNIVGYITKEFLTLGDTYIIEVVNPEYEEELLSLLIAVDYIKDAQQSQ